LWKIVLPQSYQTGKTQVRKMIPAYIILIILVLVFCDIMLTTHSAILLKQKGVWKEDLEINILPRILLGKKPSYLKSLLATPFFFLIYYIILYVCDKFLREINILFFGGIIVGILLVANYIHLYNLSWFNKHRDNKTYWEIRKKIQEAESI
jgi:hypothetical protein